MTTVRAPSGWLAPRIFRSANLGVGGAEGDFSCSSPEDDVLASKQPSRDPDQNDGASQAGGSGSHEGHRLGKAEAIRRIKEGFARGEGPLGPMIAMEQATWDGDTLRFLMRALGQTAAAKVDVLDDALRIEVSLPWLLAKAAKRLLPILRTQATLLLLEKK